MPKPQTLIEKRIDNVCKIDSGLTIDEFILTRKPYKDGYDLCCEVEEIFRMEDCSVRIVNRNGVYSYWASATRIRDSILCLGGYENH